MTPPSIITFYSYKGGVGRTAALVNSAAVMAQLGYRVLVVDFDLEAPGLDAYLAPFEVTKTAQGDGASGTLWFLTGLAAAEDSDIGHLMALHVQHFLLPTGETLAIMPAGSDDENYPQALASFDWEHLFSHRDGGRKLESWRQVLLAKYDFVLIDSRTGVTDVGGVCTIQLPDTIVVVYAHTLQSIQGTAAVLDRIQLARDTFGVDRPRAIIVPLLGKSDARSEFRESRRWAQLAHDQLVRSTSDWLPKGAVSKRAFEHLKIPYATFFSYGERLAVLDDGAEDPELPGRSYAVLANLLIRGPAADALLHHELEGRDGAVEPREVTPARDDLRPVALYDTPGRRMAAGIERTEAEHLDEITAVLRAFVPYEILGESEGVDRAALVERYPNGTQRLGELGYLSEEGRAVKLTERGQTLVKNWKALRPKELIPFADLLRSYRRAPDSLIGVFAIIASRWPYRLSEPTLADIRVRVEGNERIARAWASRLIQRAMLSLLVIVVAVVAVGVAIGLGSNLSWLIALAPFVFIAFFATDFLRLPVVPRKIAPAWRSLRGLAANGLRYEIEVVRSRSGAESRGELDYAFRARGFSREFWDVYLFDDGMMFGLERTFGFDCPVRVPLGVKVLSARLLFDGCGESDLVVTYPVVFAREVRAVLGSGDVGPKDDPSRDDQACDAAAGATDENCAQPPILPR